MSKYNTIDFKAKGQWIVSFDYGQNGNFKGNNHRQTGYNGKQDEFEALQRVRLQLDAVASENLSGTVHFEIGNQYWGENEHVGANGDGGGALGADGKIVKVKHAYLDWMIPQTDAKVRMGIQPLALPSFTTGSQIFNEDTAGVQVSYQFNDMVGATLFWARPYNDNGSYNGRSNYMDNVDMFGLSVPVTMDGVKVNPFFMLGFVGPGAINADKDPITGRTTYNTKSLAGDSYVGLFPVGVETKSRDKDGHSRYKKINQYATAWWAGLTADITAFDPFRIAFDFNYGSIQWQDKAMSRAGWLVSALAEYKMDWGTPGLVAWYTSGDDSNPKNGSERMPSLGANTTNNAFSNYAFSGAPYLAERESTIGKTMIGTWGVGLRVKDVSFVEDLKHTFRVNYIGGTNSPAMVKRYANPDAMATRNGYFEQYGRNVGNEGLYMTTMDQAVELGLSNTYKIYDNLTACLDMNYIITSLNRNRLHYTNAAGDVRKESVKDPWNINLSFMYSF